MASGGISRQASDGSMKDTLKIRFQQLRELVNDPIACGYLRAFCNTEFNAENLNFWMEVDKFKDLYAADGNWNLVKTLKEADDEFENIDLAACRFPEGATVDQAAMVDMMRSIWFEYLDDNAPQQVTCQHRHLKKTSNRMQKVGAYGTIIFDEAVVDSLKAVEKDIKPRFLKSTHYEELLQQYAQLHDPLPLSCKNDVPLPSSTLLDYTNFDELTADRKFELHEIINDRHLCGVMREYLDKCFCVENLLCVCEITFFEELMAAGERSAGRTKAWSIYRMFLLEGCPLEVSSTAVLRKDIAHSLADPKMGIFAAVKQGALAMLRADFQRFKSQPEYSGLGTMMREKYIEMNQAKKKKKKKGGLFSCLFGGGGSVRADG